MNRLVSLKLAINEVVVPTDEQHGRCVACGATGWSKTARHGYPHGSKIGMTTDLRHTAECPMDHQLHNDGTLKPISADGEILECLGNFYGPCNERVTWICCHTQFNGNPGFCTTHAEQHPDFALKEDPNNAWESFPFWAPPAAP